MGAFEFVLGLLGIIFGYKLIAIYLERRSERESSSVTERQLSDEASGRLAELEGRVQVLERIVTDQRFELDKEFEDLSD